MLQGHHEQYHDQDQNHHDDDDDQGVTGDARLWEGRQLGGGEEQQLWKVVVVMMVMQVVMIVMVMMVTMLMMIAMVMMAMMVMVVMMVNGYAGCDDRDCVVCDCGGRDLNGEISWAAA